MLKRLPILLAAFALVPSSAIAAPETFAAQAAAPAPDYAKAESWAARPGREGAASAVAPGATPAARTSRVDVFYVHPTTYRSMVRWNQDIADVATNGWTDASVIARQASVFNGCCRVFAPRYRQASSLAYANSPGDGEKAYNLAYDDVARAFAHYLKYDNKGRPFILAGHSQGGLHVSHLVERLIDGKPIGNRMVAAYVIGIAVPVGAFGTTYKSVKACIKPAQTRCIVQWNAMLPPKGDAPTRAPDADPAKTPLCINPLTFDAVRPAADKSASLGAVPGAPGFGPLLPLKAQAVSARCDKGFLIVDPDPALALTPLPGGSMHYHDIGLFYADIRANAVLRSAAFLRGK